MPQFRLTKKFATDLKLKKLGLPGMVESPLDDWFVDVIRIQRKKVAMATHGQSLLTFLLPYEAIGGAKSVPEGIGILLGNFLRDNALDFYENNIEQVFLAPPVFCKTDNRKVLGHMNDFKNCVQAMVAYHGLSFHDVNWDEVMYTINRTPVNLQGYSFPMKIAKELFSGVGI